MARRMTMGRSFLDGFQAGQAVGNSIVDAFKQSDLADVDAAKSTPQQGFTADQGAALERLANQGYAIGWDADKQAYTATPPAPPGRMDVPQAAAEPVKPGSPDTRPGSASTQPADGLTLKMSPSLGQPGTAPANPIAADLAKTGIGTLDATNPPLSVAQVVAMRPVTDFLGQRYAGDLSADNQRAARLAAKAGVFEKYGDLHGAAYLQGQSDKAALRGALVNALPKDANAAADAGTFTSYMQKSAPGVVQAYLKAGDVAGAKDYQSFVESQAGQHYVKQWLGGVRQLSVGDHQGALKTFEKMYNDQLYNDGRTVKLTPLDGDWCQVAQFDPQGNQLSRRTMNIGALTHQAALALEPATAVKQLAVQQAAATHDDALLTRTMYSENARDARTTIADDRRDARASAAEDARDARLQQRLDAMGGGNPRVTLTQQAHNDEIFAARRKLAGIDMNEVRRKTQQFSATGRENKDFDPLLLATVRKANTHFVGADPEFDKFNTRNTAEPVQTNPPSKPAEPARPETPPTPPVQAPSTPPVQVRPLDRTEVAQRFRKDMTMNGYRLGKNITADGIEVLDGRGRVIGHFH